MYQLNNHEAQTELVKGTAVIVDVREPAEFKEHHIPGALNYPLTKYNSSHYSAFLNTRICLICESGKRAKQVAKKLIQDGYRNVCILELQMKDIPKLNIEGGWTIDRQFRLVLGTLLTTYLILLFLGIEFAVIIPLILSLGLIITSIIDRCYMRMGIALLPWNKGKNQSIKEDL